MKKLLSKLRREFVAVPESPNAVKRNLLSTMASAWFSTFPQNIRAHYAPVLVMRGGLLFYTAAISYFAQPIGLLLPPRPRDTGGSLDIPNLNKAQGYILLDLIANTGMTTTLAIDLLKIHTDGVKLVYAVLFATKDSLQFIQERHPEVSVIAAFDDFVRGPSGWLKGINFDAGDLATNNPKSITRFHM